MRPIEAGKSSELIVMENLGRERDPIEKIVLFEDGKEISSVNGTYLNHEVLQQTGGTRTYKAELHTKSARKIETESIDIVFTGNVIDFAPYIQSFLTPTQEAGKATIILIGGSDIGDNRGIRKVTLYEDGEPLETVSGNSILRTVQYNSPQTHIYHAEIEDEGGQVITTKKITINYSGEAFPPSASWFIANPQQAGRTTRLLVGGKDGKNYDDLRGIARIVLYEDGNQIREEDGKSLFFEVTHNEAGNHQYHAEIYNRNGKVTTTKPINVNFNGQDFPPEVSWWHINYRSEEGLARALVEGKDEKNIRDDAGIQQIVLFEDGNPIKTVKGATLLTDLTRQLGSHTYFAEITNKSGLTTRTNEMRITYPAK